MHIPDGMLSPQAVVATGATSAGFIAYAVRWVRRHVEPERVVFMAVTAALVFALQMLNFPVAAGTSGHFAGGAMAAILLGPWPAAIVLTTVLFVQAALFGDGGVLALGANVLDLAVIGPFVGYATWRAVRAVRDTRGSRIAAAFIAAWLAVVLSAVGAGALIALSGRAQPALVIGAMSVWHAAIGIGEGAITAGLVAYVGAIRPDLLDERADRSTSSARGVLGGLAVIAVLAAGVSFIASTRPDGLEFVYAQYGAQTLEPATAFAGPLARYTLAGIHNETVAGILAGLVGLVVTGALLLTMTGALARRRPSRAHGPELHDLPHGHDDATAAHRHPHHHTAGPGAGPERPAPHSHTHTLAFERYTYLVSPVHELDPRAKLAAALVLVTGVVLAPPARPLEFALLVALLAGTAALARLPLGAMAARSALVLPLAGSIALFAPLTLLGPAHGLAGAYSAGWVLAWSIVSKAWLSACAVLLLSATTPPPALFRAMQRLRVPAVFVTMLTFLYRYAETLGSQLTVLRHAVASRSAGASPRRLVRFYGNLAGNLVVRSFERGERIHAAMLSRGFDGTLPATSKFRATATDAVLVGSAVLVALAVVLY